RLSLSWRGLREPGLQHRMRAADRRMPRERQLAPRRKDAQPVVGLRGARRQHEGRLGKIGPRGDALHLARGQSAAVEDDRDRIAPERYAREDVDLLEGELAHWSVLLDA